MSGNNLSVKITADVVDLQSKFTIARAEVSALTADMNKLARASAQGVIDPAGTARLQQVTSDFVAAKTQAAALGAQLSAASAGVLGFSRNLGESHGSISTATREFRALFDELSSGRTRQTPGTIAILLQRVAGLGPAALGTIAGVGLLTGGLGYLAYRAVEAANALNKIDLTTSFAGNMELTSAVIKRYADELARTSRLSQSDARKIVGSFAAVPGMTNAALGALTETISSFATATGESADKAAENLSKLFAQNVSAGEFAKKIEGVTQLSQAQLNAAQSADRSGDSSQIMASKLDLLSQALNAASPALKNFAGSTESSLKNYLVYTAAIAGGLSTEEAQALLYDNSAKAIDKAAAARQNLINIVKATPATPESTLKVGVEAAEKENPIAIQITQAQSKIAEMTAALDVAQQRSDQIDVAKLNAGLIKARENLSNLQFGPILERMREQMSAVAASWDGSQSGMLQKQIQVGQASLTEVQKNTKEYLAIQNEVNRLEVELKRSAGAEVIANARERIAQIGSMERIGTIDRLQSERAIWSQVLAGENLTAAQRIEIQRSLSQTISSITRQGAVEAATIARQDASADIAISRLKIEAAKSAIDLSAAADTAAIARKLGALRELTAQEFSLNNQALQNELAGLKNEPVEYDRVYNQIRELKAKLVVDLGTLDRQAAEAAKREIKEETTAWHSAVGEIENAESGLVGDVLNRRKSMAQSLQQIGAQIVTQEIANDLRAFTTKTLLNNQTKALEQGGLLYHQIVELTKSNTTKAQTAAQTAAVTAGQTAQNTAIVSGAATGKAVQAAAGPSQVMADAAEAAAGAYAATALIPYVGPILAPGAAATAFAATASFAGAASLDTGTNYVPRNMLANIHEGEAVVPKAYNPAAGGEGGGGYYESHHYGDVNLRALDARSMRSLLKGQRNRQEIASAARKFISRGGGRG